MLLLAALRSRVKFLTTPLLKSLVCSSDTNRDLALTFQSKTIDKLSAREVQEVLDEYHLEKCVKSSKGGSATININAVEIGPNTTAVCDAPEQKKTVSQDNATLEKLINMLE